MSVTAEQSDVQVDVAAVRERNRQLANEVRLAQSASSAGSSGRPSIETSRQRAAEVLFEVPEHTASMRVFDVLCAARRTGPVWARRVLATHHIYERKPIGDLTLRQAAVLAASLRNGYSQSGWRMSTAADTSRPAAMASPDRLLTVVVDEHLLRRVDEHLVNRLELPVTAENRDEVIDAALRAHLDFWPEQAPAGVYRVDGQGRARLRRPPAA
jgi:hypothetical protein